MKFFCFIFLVCCSLETILSEDYKSLAIVAPSDSVLKIRATEIPRHEISSDENQNIIDQMFEIAKGERLDVQSGVMVGLAAPQVGISKRIVLVDVSFDSANRTCGELKAFINPEIIYQSDDLEVDREGCYSVDSRLVGIVPRSKEIEVIAFDRYGNSIREKFLDFTARVFQHEVDHLDGYCFPDRMQGAGVMHFVRESDMPSYRENWETWPIQCPFDAWPLMKEGKPYEHLLPNMQDIIVTPR